MHVGHTGDGVQEWAGGRFALMVNFDLHLRKAFWVDEALAFVLARNLTPQRRSSTGRFRQGNRARS